MQEEKRTLRKSHRTKKGTAFAVPFLRILLAAEAVIVSASSAEEEKQDNPQAAIVTAAIATGTDATAIVIATAAK